MCALVSNGDLKCWGRGDHGELGLGSRDNIGDDELPSSMPPISVTKQGSGSIQQVVAGDGFTCALLGNHTVKCWGDASYGAVGQGNTENIGDDELPSSVPPIQLF